MNVTEETLGVIHDRLRELSTEATPDQLAYLAKAYQTIAGSGKMLDIAYLADKKIDELIAEAESQIASIEANKNNALAVISNKKNDYLNEFSTSTNNNLSLISSFIATKKAELISVTERFEDVNDVPIGSSILKEIEKEGERRKFVQNKAMPFIYGILSRSNDYYGTANFTSELGSWYNSASNADNMLKLLTGSHDYTTSYAGFYKEPSLCFLQGEHGIFIQKEMYLRYASTSTMYQYPYAALGVFFIKNTTEEPITRKFYFGGSSYWSSGYEGAGAFVGSPNASDIEQESINAISWSNIYSTSTSSSNFSANADFTVPPKSTIALLLYTSAYYYTNTSSYYAQFIHWYVYNLRSMSLGDGLEIDVERTLKAWQCKGFSTTTEIWK